MHLSEKDWDVLKLLLDLEKLIYDYYFEKDPKENLDALLDAIEMEESFIKSLKINKYKLAEIETFMRQLIGDLPKKDLLVGTASTLDKDRYPFFRLFSKLSKIVEAQNFGSLGSVFNDKEVEVLFKLLIDEASNREAVSDELRKDAYKILMDSNYVEVESIENGLEAFDSVTITCSMMRFNTIFRDILLKILYFVKFNTSKDVFDDTEFFIPTSNLMAAVHSVKKSFKKGLFKIKHLVKSSGKKVVIEDEAEFIVLSCYLKAAILFIEPAKRKEILETILADEVFNRSDFEKEVGFVKNYVIKLFAEVDDIACVKYLELVPKSSETQEKTI